MYIVYSFFEQHNFNVIVYWQLQVHVVAESGDHQEVMSVIVKVIDQNDNKPVFSQNTFEGQVAENSAQGTDSVFNLSLLVMCACFTFTGEKGIGC